MATLADGSVNGSYPAGQKARPAPSTEIKAEVFRERDAAGKADTPTAPYGGNPGMRVTTK